MPADALATLETSASAGVVLKHKARILHLQHQRVKKDFAIDPVQLHHMESLSHKGLQMIYHNY